MAAAKWRRPPPRDAGNGPRNCRKLASRDRSNIAKSQAKGQESRRSLRARIYEFIRENPNCTFRDVEALPGYRGDQAFMFSPNVLLWPGLSAAAGAALADLLKSGVIETRAADIFDYTRRRPGEAVARLVSLPALPITSNRDAALSRPHWFPAVLHACDAWAESADEARAN